MDHADDGVDGDVFIYMGGLIPEHLRETITHIRVHESVKIITPMAFFECRNLVSKEMHDGVEIIGQNAFWGCTSLRGIKLSGVRVIERGAFAGCSSLRGIKLQSVRVIVGQAFSKCTALENVEFGDKLETIGNVAFQGTALRSIKLPKVRVIQEYAFWDCRQLTEAELSKDLERIEVDAFQSCPRLRRIAIPLKANIFDEVGDEDFHVFHECDNLSQVDLVGGIHKTVSSLLLESWRNDMNDEIDRINRDLPNTSHYEKTALIHEWTERVLRRIEHYKSEHYALLKNNMTQLELALWKANLPNLDAALASRQKARVTCGANIIIPHVLSFLNDTDEFPLREYNL